LLGQTKGVRVLLTTQVPLDQTISFGERILPLEPLSPADCAKLLLRLCPQSRTRLRGSQRRHAAALLSKVHPMSK
jgi:hypothetical protein